VLTAGSGTSSSRGLWPSEFHVPILSASLNKLLVTGSSGLIGSEVCSHFASLGWQEYGLDNNQRAVFIGDAADTPWNQRWLQEQLGKRFVHQELDIRDRPGVLAMMDDLRPEAIVHTAAQPPQDRAAAIPFDDFDSNAMGTLNLLEATRQSCPESPFVHLSTNKVYGDRPNTIALKELEMRWDYDDPVYADGIAESFSIDQSKHSLFGASNVASDVMVQEYGRYFGIPSCCLRGGCLTGPNHSVVELHRFLSYLVKCNLEGRLYKVFGYKGKQVRDNIHSHDVARFIEAFLGAPRVAEVYNLGGARANSCSILEAFQIPEQYSGKAQVYEYVDQNRIGDYICYISDLSKMCSHYPGWDISISLEQTISEIVASWQQREVA